MDIQHQRMVSGHPIILCKTEYHMGVNCHLIKNILLNCNRMFYEVGILPLNINVVNNLSLSFIKLVYLIKFDFFFISDGLFLTGHIGLWELQLIFLRVRITMLVCFCVRLFVVGCFILPVLQICRTK